MNKEYGKSDFGIDEHQVVPLMADWMTTWRKVLQACLSMRGRINARVIAEQIGSTEEVVQAIWNDDRFRSDLYKGMRGTMQALFPHCCGVIEECLQDGKPDMLRFKAATWLIERADTLFKEVVKKEPEPLANEKALQEAAARIKARRFAMLQKKAKDAEVTSGGQAVEATGTNGSHDAPGAAPLGELGREGGCDQSPVFGAVQARQVDVPIGPDCAGSPDII